MQALRHSKVSLTWDEDDPERGNITRRALTKQEIEEGDFRAYIASSSGSESEGEGSNDKKTNKKFDRDRLRALLLGGNEEAMPEGWGDDGGDDVDMEITFTPGLLGKVDKEDETTLEKYQRKIREKRKKRKEEVKEKSGHKNKEKGMEDEFFEVESDDDQSSHLKSKKKSGKGKKRDEEGTQRGREATAEELELLLTTNNPDSETKHVDFKAVVKADKKGKRGKKGKKGKKEKKGEDELQEDFVIDVQDERFKVIHEDHQFAIDPSNPQYVSVALLCDALADHAHIALKRPRACLLCWKSVGEGWRRREERIHPNGIPPGQERVMATQVSKNLWRASSVKAWSQTWAMVKASGGGCKRQSSILFHIMIYSLQPILALEKSSSGCCAWNFLRA